MLVAEPEQLPLLVAATRECAFELEVTRPCARLREHVDLEPARFGVGLQAECLLDGNALGAERISARHARAGTVYGVECSARSGKCARRVVVVRQRRAEKAEDGAACAFDDGAVSFEDEPNRFAHARRRLRVHLGVDIVRRREADRGDGDRQAPLLLGALHRRRRECRVLDQDLPFELAECLRRLEREGRVQLAAETPVRRERVGLPATAIQREHEVADRALTGRLGAHERLELGDEFDVAPECELGVEKLLACVEQELLEPPGDLVERRRGGGHVGEGTAAPELERAPEPVDPIGRRQDA